MVKDAMKKRAILALCNSCLWLIVLFSSSLSFSSNCDSTIPIGQSYHGPKSRAAIKSFVIAMKGAPPDIANGFKDMLETALFESNYFEVIDRADTSGLSAEQLLSDEILENPDAIINQKRATPADILIYGAVTDLEGGGWGIVFKIPGSPVVTGGAYRKTRISIEIRAVDSSTGDIIFAEKVHGTAYGGMGIAGASFGAGELPVELTMIRNTPMELAVRDCLYRTVLHLCRKIPRYYFKYKDTEKGR